MNSLFRSYALLCSALPLALMGCGDGDPAASDASADGSADTGADTAVQPDTGLPEGCVGETESGAVTGSTSEDQCVYLGIPYVAPPVGELRFAPPQAHAGWTGPLAADTRGPVCLQRTGTGAMATLVGEEDCLSLNLWAPVEPGPPRPVMVFIHGGGFIQGAGNLELYDSSLLARSADAVVVTFNYRIGALGFLATDELIAESEDGSAGNYGIQDQRAALQWVQRNIAAFGGDPSRVTIFGESAGAVSVCAQLGSPLSDGLYDRAIMQSGGGCATLPPLTSSVPAIESAVDKSAPILAAAGCDGADVLSCLRGLDAVALTQAFYDGSETSGLGLPEIGPNIDGLVLPQQPLDRIAAGEADVPVIIGSNADESFIFLISTPVPTEMAYQNLVRATVPALADDLLALYPVADYDSPKDAYHHLFSDVGFICPALSLVQAAAAGQPAYTYHFTHGLTGPASVAGAFHGLELFFLSERFDQLPFAHTPNEADLQVGEDLREGWSLFANGQPLNIRGQSWPAYSEGEPAFMIFDDPSTVTDEIRGGRCERLREIGAIR